MNVKIIHALLALVLVMTSVLPSTARAQELTVEEKYQALVDAGVFEGFVDGSIHLDWNDTRAQAAMMICKLLGLEENAAAAGIYRDLFLDHWAAGYIGAVTEAGIFRGNGSGLFNPDGMITIQEMAVVLVNILGLEVDPVARVEGADAWAAGYVAAAVAAGIIPELSDYTAPATRRLLVEASYEVYAVLETRTESEQEAQAEEGEPGIRWAGQTGARRVGIQFGSPVDPAAATVGIERIGDGGERTAIAIDTLEWSGDGMAVTAVLRDPAKQDTYEARVDDVPDGEPVTYRWRFEMEPERVERIELGGSDTLPRMNGVEIPISFLNQFGEPMSPRPVAHVSASHLPTRPKWHPERDIILLDLDQAGVGEHVSLHVIEELTASYVIRSYRIGERPDVHAIEADGFVNEAGEPVQHLKRGEAAYLVLRPYDQYGNLVSDLPWLNENLRAEQTLEGLSVPKAQKTLVHGPGGVVAVRVTGDTFPMDVPLVVTVRSASGSELVQAAITLLGEPSLFVPPITRKPPMPTVTVDRHSIVTVTKGVYSHELMTYATVHSRIADRLHFALLPDHVSDLPTVEQLLSGSDLPKGTHYAGHMATSGEAILELPTHIGKFRLCVIGSFGSSVSIWRSSKSTCIRAMPSS